MKCRRCGAEIDTRRQRSDGSVQCPECKTIYRPRTSSASAATAQKKQPNRQSSGRKTAKGKLWNRKYWKLPLWAWCTIGLLLIICIIGSAGNNSAQNSPTTSTDSVDVTQQPDTSEWLARFAETEPDVIAYINDALGAYEIDGLTMDCFPDEPDFYSAVFKAKLYDSTDAGLKSAIIEISQLTPEYHIGYGITFVDQTGAGICNVAWDSLDGQASRISINQASKPHAEYDSPDEMP